MVVDANEESEFAESRENRNPVVERNIKALVNGLTPYKLGGVSVLVGAVIEGDSIHNPKWPEDDELTNVIITYNTRTGEFQPMDRSVNNGKQSRFRTYMWKRGEKRNLVGDRWEYVPGTYEICTFNPLDGPMGHEVDAAVDGRVDLLQSEGRQILPERIIHPEEGHNRVGREEPIGGGGTIDNPTGDRVMVESVLEFNRRYGPDLAKALFSGVK